MATKNWIQKAVNPKHKGYCTPMSKATCTPHRKALAERFKNMDKKQHGGAIQNSVDTINNMFIKYFGIIKELKKGGRLSKDYIKEAKDKPGGSNVGNKTFSNGDKRTGPYIGPSGGAPKGSYPIPDISHARAALRLAHNAPNPEGIKKAVYNKYPELKKHFNGGKINLKEILSIWKK